MIDFFNNTIRLTLAPLRAFKIRILLATFGVMLGAFALTAGQFLTISLTTYMSKEIERLGPDLLMVRAGKVQFSHGGQARMRMQAQTFTLADTKALIVASPEIITGTSYISATANIASNNVTISGQITAVQSSFPRIRDFHPAYGSFFTSNDEQNLAKVCVLGNSLAVNLFGSPQAAMGKKIVIKQIVLSIVGVMEIKGNDLSGADQDSQVFVPLLTYSRRMANVFWTDGAMLLLRKNANLDKLMPTLTKILRQRHNLPADADDDFTIMSAADASKSQVQILSLIGMLGMISSSISFGIGGIGILSAMVLLVKIRKQEIGIRRAIGASSKTILVQFVIESSLIGFIGGAAGLVLSIAVTSIIFSLTILPFVFPLGASLFAFFASGSLGFMAGVYPAWQASRVNVLAVLKSD